MQGDAGVAIAREQQFLLLGEAHRDEPLEPDLAQRVIGGAELSLATINNDEVREGAALLHQFLVAAEHDFLHGAEVVERHVSDAELPVLALLHPSFHRDHHRRDRVTSLQRRDVETLDPARQTGQVQHGAERIERFERRPGALAELLLIGHRGVARRQVEQAALVPALRHLNRHLPPGAIRQPRFQRFLLEWVKLNGHMHFRRRHALVVELLQRCRDHFNGVRPLFHRFGRIGDRPRRVQGAEVCPQFARFCGKGV